MQIIRSDGLGSRPKLRTPSLQSECLVGGTWPPPLPGPQSQELLGCIADPWHWLFLRQRLASWVGILCGASHRQELPGGAWPLETQLCGCGRRWACLGLCRASLCLCRPGTGMRFLDVSAGCWPARVLQCSRTGLERWLAHSQGS